MSDYKNDDLYTDDDGIEFMDDFNEIDDDYDDSDDSANIYTKHKTNNDSSLFSEFLSYIKIIVIAVVIAFVFTTYVIVNAQVPTGSMKNTIMEGDRLIGFRLAYVFSEPQRGDIVIFKFPDNEEENYVKRIIGIPGDVIQITGGHVYVNDTLSSEEYIREAMIDTETELTYIVPEDCYFMLGDNRNSSLDSRFWDNTFVHKDKILAKVIFRYYDGENRHLSFRFIK